MAESYSVSQGSSLLIPATICDTTGTPIVYTGSEALATTIWPGGNRSLSYTPTTTWTTPASGAILITIPAGDTTGLLPGRYQLLTRVTVAGQDPADAYACTVEVLPFAGTVIAPKTYCDYSWLLKFGRSWLKQLQTDDDEAGFAEQLGRARTWIEDIGHAHFRVAGMTMVIGSQAFGPRRSGARSTWLQDQFDLNYLMVTDQIRECAAKKALAYICEGQVGVSESAQAYAKLARMYHSQANYLGTCMILSLDTNQDGFPDVNIDCSSSDPMYG